MKSSLKLKNPNQKVVLSSDYEGRLIRPNAPTEEMIAAAQPYRADVVGADQLIELAKRSAALAK